MLGFQKRLERQLVAAITAEKPNVPEAGRLLWTWFLDLSATRAVGMGGPAAITFGEIEAYARLHALPVSFAHVTIIRAMDAALMARWQKEQASPAPDGVDKLPHLSTQPVTPANFDAMFI